VHLLTGKAPYDTATTSDFDIQMAIVQEPLDIRSLSDEWQLFLKPYLAKRPEERPVLQHFLQTGTEKNFYLRKARSSSPTYIYSDEETLVENAGVGNSKTSGFPPFEKDQSFIINGVPFTMKYVEGGTFQMGATSEQGNDVDDDEKPVHEVKLSDFYIGETEVTQRLWKAIMVDNPSYFKGDNLPVENVSWDDCQKFIQKLNQLTSKTFRLPTEAEWEYAARGGDKSRRYKYAGSNSIGEVGWCEENDNSATHPVKGKRANELGLYDMSGNVWEWCEDWAGGYNSSELKREPDWPSRVLRGGCCSSRAKSCRVSARGHSVPFYCGNHYGFRLALVNE